MNRELAKKVADAVLYEGYMLYPYRVSALKNQQRWCFGILYPPGYHEVRSGTERSSMHSECLMEITGSPALHIELRFLQLQRDGSPESMEQAVERSVDLEVAIVEKHPQSFDFAFSGSRAQPLTAPPQHALKGSVSFCCETLPGGVVKLVIDVSNRSEAAPDRDRNAALLHSLLSAHTILTVNGGQFISLLDPPADLKAVARDCKNIGNFPVLIGDPGERDMMLCSPIVLYDYPQVAPESAGDFYDATEIDEMLTLRVMTLTESEKDEVRLAGDRTRTLLERTEQSAREQLTRTHGTMRTAGDKP